LPLFTNFGEEAFSEVRDPGPYRDLAFSCLRSTR
jgi:hypothetical protein